MEIINYTLKCTHYHQAGHQGGHALLNYNNFKFIGILDPILGISVILFYVKYVQFHVINTI